MIVLVMIFYFWWRGILFLDPDFGWHLQMGWLIEKNGIPATDPFSYTMGSYPFVDHEWLTNLLLAKGIDTVGNTILAGIFALVAVAAFSLQLLTVSEKGKRFVLPFLLLALLSVTGAIGIRPQLLTWFFFSLVLIVIRDQVRFKKYRWFLPLLFMVWVNLHGGFAIGIVALFLATVYWWYKNPAQKFVLLGVFAASVAATFLMPYGLRGWWEVWMQMTDGSLRWTIMEWTPAIFVPNMLLWLFIIFSVMFVGRYIKKFSLLDLLLYGGLLVSGISSIRHAPLWLLIALPLTIEAVAFFYQDITKIKYAVGRFGVMAKLFLVLIFLFAVLDLRSVAYGLGFFGKQGMYPEHAVTYLREHQSKGQLFSFYNWGGYLIWKLPEKRVFIDGRMPSWRWSVNVPGESKYAFDDYQKILDGTIPFASVVEKYRIDTLLFPIPGEKSQNPLENILVEFGTNVLHLPLKEDVGFTKVVKQAKKAGWVVVYQDDTAVIYKKIKSE